MALVIRKQGDEETWRECALRYGKKYGLEAEVRDEFDKAVKRGSDEREAALCACLEWDIAEYEES